MNPKEKGNCLLQLPGLSSRLVFYIIFKWRDGVQFFVDPPDLCSVWFSVSRASGPTARGLRLCPGLVAQRSRRRKAAWQPRPPTWSLTRVGFIPWFWFLQKVGWICMLLSSIRKRKLFMSTNFSFILGYQSISTLADQSLVWEPAGQPTGYLS